MIFAHVAIASRTLQAFSRTGAKRSVSRLRLQQQPREMPAGKFLSRLQRPPVFVEARVKQVLGRIDLIEMHVLARRVGADLGAMWSML